MRTYSYTKVLAGSAIFAALAYLVSYLEFPIFPAAPFLKLDFSAVFTLLGSFMFGPVSGVAICVVKEALCALTKSSTGGVGEIANVFMTVAFIIVPAVAYRYKKGLPWVCVYLVSGVVLQTAVALVTNRYINFPLYVGDTAESMFLQLWPFIVYFNLIKGAANSVITLLLYKHVSHLFKAVGRHGENPQREKESEEKKQKNSEAKN